MTLIEIMATRKGMFGVFADEDEDTTQQVVKKEAPKKPAQPKPAAPKEERPVTAKAPRQQDQGDFDGVVGASAPRGGRGGRGGRGAPRGGRGGERRPRPEGEGHFERRPRPEGAEGQYERRPRPEGEGQYERRPRTEGGEGRGRGRRPPRTEGGAVAEGGDEGMPVTAHKERHHVDTKDHHFQGRRTEKHQFDRKDGTGRGRAGPVKGGAGKGNWGTVKDELQTSPATEVKEGEEATATPAEEAKVEDAKVEETPVVEERQERPPVVDKEEEENKNKLTYQEYLAQKKKSNLKKETRAHEEVKRTGLEAAAPKKEKISQINSTLKDQEVYNVAVGKTELANLLHFQAQEDEYPERSDRRGGRGGRGGFRGTRGGRPEGAPRGGRQQQLRMDENAFPSLD